MLLFNSFIPFLTNIVLTVGTHILYVRTFSNYHLDCARILCCCKEMGVICSSVVFLWCENISINEDKRAALIFKCSCRDSQVPFRYIFKGFNKGFSFSAWFSDDTYTLKGLFKIVRRKVETVGNGLDGVLHEIYDNSCRSDSVHANIHSEPVRNRNDVWIWCWSWGCGEWRLYDHTSLLTMDIYGMYTVNSYTCTIYCIYSKWCTCTIFIQ